MTTLRISQYVTIIYALMYLFYERTDWNVLRFKIPDVMFGFDCSMLFVVFNSVMLCTETD